MKKIALIGAGQLGSRHLQGLAKSDLDISIEVVEPFKNARETAKERYQQVPLNEKVKNINFLENISETSNTLDLAIVATNADVRYQVVKELLENKKIKNLILEKVLFQKLEEYNKIKDLLEKTTTKCWVNHPRRMFPFYKSLKNELKDAKHIHLSVSGGAWGLGCNGLHFLDCFSYLLNEKEIYLDPQYLDNALYKTKRKGFSEINGMLTGKIKNNIFTINCFAEESSPVQFNITSDKLEISIDEANGWYKISKKENNWKHQIIETKIVYFQSELTNILLNNIFTNSCTLPAYEEAMALHVNYITMLLKHINSFSDSKYEICPIT